MFAVSFDFHDTVAICPTWFQLETRHLVSSAYAELARAGALVDGPAPEALDAAYRQLRLAIHEHGNERDAVGCVLDVLTGLDIACSCEAVAAAVERLQRATLADCRPRPGIIEAIHQLSAAGMPIGITSNAVYHPFLLWSLDRFGLLPLLQSVISSASCGYYKSRPEIFRATAAALDTPPERVIHVGDSFRFDVAAARRAGLGAVVWLNLKGEAPPEPDLADLIVTDLDGLAEKIQRLAAGH